MIEEDPDMAAPKRPNSDRIVDAAMACAARTRWREVTLADIAAEAKVSLAQLHEVYRSKPAIVAALGDRVDRAVLAGTDADAGAEPVHDRLLDVLMRRLDALAPHKDAVASILRDDSPDHGGTLAHLDTSLRRAERLAVALSLAPRAPRQPAAEAAP
jgi:AcrR family transcriptional regulator